MLKYIVSIEYRLNGERKAVKTYKEAATIEDAKNWAYGIRCGNSQK